MGQTQFVCDKEVFELGIPCTWDLLRISADGTSSGRSVATAPVSEYGKTDVTVDTESALFQGVSPVTTCWMSHTDYIEAALKRITITAHTPVSCCSHGVSGKEALRSSVPS